MVRIYGAVAMLMVATACDAPASFHEPSFDQTWEDGFIEVLDTGMAAYAMLEDGAYVGEISVVLPEGTFQGELDLELDRPSDLPLSGHGVLTGLDPDLHVEVWMVGVSDDPPFYSGELVFLLDGEPVKVPWHGVGLDGELLAEPLDAEGEIVAYPLD